MNVIATFIIPTFNADKYLSRCLRSITQQRFPKLSFEVYIIDGGSTDGTLEIAKEYSKKLQLKVLKNSAVDAESGKRLGIQKAKGKYIILLDADNQIIGTSWLKTGIAILEKHRDVWGVESEWLVNKNDPPLNQYFAMLAITDPVARVFSPTSNQMKIEDHAGYQLVTIEKNNTPIIGANGFFYRRSLIKKEITKTKKFEEVNYVAQLISEGHQTYGVIKKSGIYHHYCTSVWDYVAKRRKIARKFLQRKAINQTTWLDKVGLPKFLLAVIYNFSIVGPLTEAIFQILKTKNTAWFFHPIISFITVVSYTYFFLLSKIKLLHTDQNKFKYFEGLTIIGILLLYLPILNSYFQQDEWHNFGIHIYGLAEQGFWSYFFSLFFTGMPLAFLYTFFNYWLFGVQNLIPAIVILMLIAMNSLIWLRLVKKISGSNWISLFSLIIGYTSYLSVQAVTWVLPAISAQLALFFILSSIYCLYQFQQKSLIKYLGCSLIFATAAALVRNNGFLIFLGLPFFSFIFSKQKNWTELKKSFFLLIVLGVIAIGIILTRASTSRIGSGRYLHSETQVLLNTAILPTKSISQFLLLDPQVIYKLGSELQTRYYNRATDPLFTYTVMADLISVIISLLVMVLFVITFRLRQERQTIFYFALFLYVLSFSPYVLDIFSTGTGYLESRYYYIGAFAFGLLFCLYFESLFVSINKMNIPFRHGSIGLLTLLPVVFVLFNLRLVSNEIKLRNELTNKRHEILEFAKNQFVDQLDNSFIIYIEDTNFPNPSVDNATGRYFQTGFLYPFLVYVYDTGKIPHEVFADDYFWDSAFQGVRETQDYRIGLFYAYNDLKKYVQLNNLNHNDILSIQVDYSELANNPEAKGDMHDLRYVTYRDITEITKKRLASEQ